MVANALFLPLFLLLISVAGIVASAVGYTRSLRQRR